MDDACLTRRAVTASQIKEAMEAAGFTRKMLADKLGKSPSEITRWLSGKHNFTSDVLAAISEALGREITGVPTPEDECIVSGYLREPHGQCCIPMLTLSLTSFRNLQRMAEKAGLSVRRFAEKVLSDESRKGEPEAADFCGILGEDFPTSEALRAMRIDSNIVEL